LRMDHRILESKKKRRKELASLSFSEKIKILEKLRDRDRAIAAAGLRRKISKDTPSIKMGSETQA
jgi:hypothetical protein